MPYAPSLKPVDTVSTQWLVSSPATVANFSAAAYFFARELHDNLPNVAIGVIHASFGASTIQCWMPHDAIAAIPSVAAQLATFDAAPNVSTQHNPFICYNGQIHPLAPYAIRGVIWYQGESVTWGDNTYRDLQIGQIEAWRKVWGQDFTFLVTQLANYAPGGTFPFIREAQLQATETVFNTGLAVTIDIGNPTYIHPGDKQDVGLRLGLAARAITYGQAVPYSGPLYDHMTIEGSSIRLFFKHTETGLTFKGNVGTGFEIAGANNVFSPATAVIDAATSTVVVSSPAVTAPKNVHYAWAGNPMASLYNGGAAPLLPASPFRTDAVPLPPPIVGGASDAGLVTASDAGLVAASDAGSTADGSDAAADATTVGSGTADADTAAPSADGADTGPAPSASSGDTDAAGATSGLPEASASTSSSGSPGAATGGAGGCSCRIATRHDGTGAGLAACAAGWVLIAWRRARRKGEPRALR